ncbi:roadblock/LC7 domain-containing protein [Nitriliruptor alkaliphilus]|uniref:roadblock/LC7 domain-containing protein n=1 Tax=Nitriliruptor alkaliphilus TaxID=427918 RepID=UPI0009FB905C|nr:roadblock/LC7 domain-containing protein [Nitriliruptor alkaliphilus]
MNTGSRADRLAVALDEFVRSSPDVEAAAVVSFDGLPMASALPAELEEDRVGAMSAALLSLGEQAAMGLGRGLLNQIFVEGEHGFVFLMSARDQAVLTAIAGRSAKIGFMLFEMRRAADRIGRALETSSPGMVAPEAAAVSDVPPPPAPAPAAPDDDAERASTPEPAPAPVFDPEHASEFAGLNEEVPAPEGALHHLPPRSAASE